jgi:alkaline phosphatase D
MPQTLILFILCSLPFKAFSQQSNTDKLKKIQKLDRLAFGSCNKQYATQSIWRDLILQTPDIFIWGGDNIYADTKNAEDIKKAYQIQNEVEDYKFFKSLTPIIGTWDDHDFGINDADGNYPLKALSRLFALDFLEEPIFSARRLREGIYTSYDFGDLDRKIKIILLDNRYFMKLENDAPLLGNVQWRWLEEEIKKSDASLHLIVSGLSVLSPENPSSEEWVDFKREQLRLMTILRSRPIPYLYLTGDKHFSSIFTKDGELEFLSSGMTHNTRYPLRPWVRRKYPNPVFEKNYGMIDFYWENSLPILTLSIRSVSGTILQEKKVAWKYNGWNEI